MTDILLEWMSFRGSGQIQDIPDELTEGEDAYKVVRDFVTLGHLEFTDRTSWRIAPPVLAGLPPEGSEVAAVLCGARTPVLMRCLYEACAKEGANVECRETGRAALVRVTANGISALVSFAAAAGIPLQKDAGFTMLACTPTISEWPRKSCPMVGGNVGAIRRFSRSEIDWVASTLEEAEALPHGFFRIERDRDRAHILKSGHAECAYMDSRAGCLLVCAKHRLVSYDAAFRTLSMPRTLFPPILIARALSLCSGTLPRIEGRRVSFPDVPMRMMQLALAIMQLRLT